MRLVTLVAKPGKLDDIAAAAVRAGATGLTATHVRGFGQQFGHMRQAAHAEVAALMLPKREYAPATGMRTLSEHQMVALP
jgi:nitrogen regulatory protein PII